MSERTPSPHAAPIVVRAAREDDFAAVCALLAELGRPEVSPATESAPSARPTCGTWPAPDSVAPGRRARRPCDRLYRLAHSRPAGAASPRGLGARLGRHRHEHGGGARRRWWVGRSRSLASAAATGWRSNRIITASGPIASTSAKALPTPASASLSSSSASAAPDEPAERL